MASLNEKLDNLENIVRRQKGANHQSIGPEGTQNKESQKQGPSPVVYAQQLQAAACSAG
jgi:hypothetical protein